MLGVVIVIAAYAYRDLIIKVASVYVPASPKAVAPGPASMYSNRGVLFVNAPWALSALPECFTQTSSAHGSLHFVLAHMPRNVVRIAPPATLHYANCTVIVRANDAAVIRGGDRFHVPPRTSFYERPGELVLLRTQGRFAELRTYAPAKR